MYERNTYQLPLPHPQPGTWHNPGMCPDQESNQRPFGSQARAQTLSHTSQGTKSFLKPSLWQALHKDEKPQAAYRLASKITKLTKKCSSVWWCHKRGRLWGTVEAQRLEWLIPPWKFRGAYPGRQSLNMYSSLPAKARKRFIPHWWKSLLSVQWHTHETAGHVAGNSNH